MANEIHCFDNPEEILGKPFCLSALSKDLKGEMELTDSKEQECREPRCLTLRTIHTLRVEVRDTRCDSDLARALNGKLEAKLFTAFETDGMHRGVHAAPFQWEGWGGVLITGHMSGVTNEGSHREPIRDCQRCEDTGIFEGRLCGQVTQTSDEALRDCEIMAAYRVQFDPSTTGGSGAVSGTIEGLIISPCE